MNKFLESAINKYASSDIHEFRGDPTIYNSKELMDDAIKYSREYYRLREKEGLDPFEVPTRTTAAKEVLMALPAALIGGIPGSLAGGVVGDILADKLKARRKNRDRAVLSGAALGGLGGYLLARKGITSATKALRNKFSRVCYDKDPYLYLLNFKYSDPRAAEYVDKLYAMRDKLNAEPDDVKLNKYTQMMAEAQRRMGTDR